MRMSFRGIPTRLVFLLACLPALLTAPARAQSTAFTYQGELKVNGVLATGVYDMRFRLFDAASGGLQLGSQICADNVTLTAGRFGALLDFGPEFASPQSRFLEIEVRADTGLTCASAGGFTILAPRIQLTAAPLANHARSAFSLDAADGSPTDAVFVDNNGRVGIGTTAPGSLLDIQGANNSNILFGRRSGGGLAHNMFIDGSGNGSMQFLDGSGVVRINLGAQDTTYFNYGNVGVGTATPISKLDVRGDIRFGSSGQLLAAGGANNFRIVIGQVAPDGTILSGTGFTVSRFATGAYTVTFSPAFSGPPALSFCSSVEAPVDGFYWNSLSGSSVQVFCVRLGNNADGKFTMTAIGPR